jgi:hypothetical protein
LKLADINLDSTLGQHFPITDISALTHIGNTMITTEKNQLAELLPSLGYFGSTTNSALRIACDSAFTAIRITLGTDEPEILNLLEIQAFKDNSAIDLRAVVKGGQLSSDYYDNPAQSALKLLDAKGIHSKRQVSPAWDVEMSVPVDADYIQIRNRPDEWGKRSRSLKVSVRNELDSWQEIYSAYSASHASQVLIEALKTARFLDSSGIQSNIELRLRLIDVISDNLKSGTVSLRETDWYKLVQLTQIWTQYRLSNAEWNIYAAMILAERLSSKNADLMPYGSFLYDKQQIESLHLALNRISTPAGLGKLSITRHGLQFAKLGTHRDVYMKLLADVFALLEDMGLQPFLSYGTLLGARRNGKFIDHDDDVDLVYLIQGHTSDQRQAEMKTIFSQLRSRGFPVNPSPGGLNAHVFGKDNGIVVDIFPCWIEEGRLHLHMEKMLIRDIDSGLVYPRGTIKLNDETMPAPGNPDGFLTERYGEGWRISDPYFEWPWQLKDN